MKTEGWTEPYEEQKKKLWTTGRIICAVLATAGLMATAWLIYIVVANPFSGPRMMPLFLMMASSACFVNMSIAIPQSYLIRSKGLRLLTGAGKLILTIVLPFILMASVNNSADNRTLEIAGAELAPVVGYIDTEFSRHGKFPADILGEVKKVKKLTNITYLYGDKSFILQTRGSSADIDGSTIFYISSEKKWRREHNDLIDSESTENASLYRDTNKGLTKSMYWRNYKTGQWEVYKRNNF